MNSIVVEVSPSLAKQYLEKSKGNRAESKERISTYAKNMKDGLWQLTPQGISFDEDGVLVDGHHRLKAVIQSGVSVPFYVTLSVPRQTTIFDRGRPRTTGQFLKYNEGINKTLTQNKAVAGIRLYLSAKAKQKNCKLVSDMDVLSEIKENEDTLIKASTLTNGVFTNSTAFFESLYTALKHGCDFQSVKEFTEIVNSGMYENKKQTAAVAIRNLLVRELRIYSDRDRLLLCACIQTCLSDFLEGRERRLVRFGSIKNLCYDGFVIE